MICPACQHSHEGTPTRCHHCETPLALDGRLSLIKALGRGGSSQTYLARDSDAEREVALKVLDLSKMDEWKQLELFKRQHEVLSKLDVEGVPKAYAMFEIETSRGPRWCFEHEYIAGKTLQVELDEGRRFDEDEARGILEQLLEILSALHRLSPPLIHRDIKPSNIMVTPEAKVALIDFDTATGDNRDPLRRDATLVGTAGFVPLEQLAGQASPASDLYAVGMTLVALLSRRPVTELPIEGGRVRFEEAISVSPSFKALISRLLSPAVEERPQSAEEVRRALAAPLTQAGPRHGELQERIPAERPRSRKRFGALHIALVLGVLILGTSIHLYDSHRASEVAAQKSVIAPARLIGDTKVKLLRSDREHIQSLSIVWASSASKVSSQRHERLVSQAVGGVPDVWPERIDARGAWTSRWQNAGYETLEVGFSPKLEASGIVVFESLNPGAIYRLSLERGGETLALWERRGEVPLAGDHQVLAFKLDKPELISRLTLTLDTRLVKGFNAIDAVGLIPAE